MKRLLPLLVVASLVVASCGGGKRTSTPAPGDTAPAAPVAAVDVAEVPQVGRIYSEAVRKARNEINADNAKKRLTEIEREIEAEVTSAR